MLRLHIENTGVNLCSAAPKSKLSDGTAFFEARNFKKTQVGRDVSHRLVDFKKLCHLFVFCTNTNSLLHVENIMLTQHSAAPKSELSDSTAFFEGDFFPPGAELEALLTRSDCF